MDNIKDGWRTDWREFAEVLGVKVRGGDTGPQLADFFGGKSVVWCGKLTELLIDDLAPLVTVSLPEVEVDLGELGLTLLGDQSLPVARDAIPSWRAIPIGSDVKFIALLGTGVRHFPPIEIVQMSDGEAVVMIRLSDCRPV